MSSGDRSANPATSCASGHSGLRRAHISGSTRKRSGLGMSAPSEEGFRAVSSDGSCRFAVSERRSDCTTTYTSRNTYQSREAGTSSRILTAWKLLPNISHWILQTIEKGYQYSPGLARPGLWGCFHRGGPPAGSGNGTRSENSVREGAIKYVPHSNRETGLYSWYFIVPKKDGGLRPILDLRVLNDSVMQLKFKMLTLRQSCHRSDPMIGLSR